MDRKDKNQEANDVSPKVEISSEALDALISGLQSLRVTNSSTLPSGSGKKFELSPITKSCIGAQSLQIPGTKVQSIESIRY